MQIHNSSSMLIKNCKFLGQMSKKDNAIGLAVTGMSSDLYMEHNEFSYNCGWSDSNKFDMPISSSYRCRYDLSAIKPLWDILFTTFDQAGNGNEVGFLDESNTLIAQVHKEFDGSGDDITVRIGRWKNTFVNIVAPLSAGLVLADCCYSGTLLHNKFHANKGNAGYCSGLTCHQAEIFLTHSNNFDDNAANIYVVFDRDTCLAQMQNAKMIRARKSYNECQPPSALRDRNGVRGRADRQFSFWLY